MAQLPAWSQEMIDEADTNGNGVISYEEFAGMMVRLLVLKVIAPVPGLRSSSRCLPQSLSASDALVPII
jgi:hypothetical protein